jgi:hypothetical protein
MANICWVCCWYWYQNLGGAAPPQTGHAFLRQWHMRRERGVIYFCPVFFPVWCHPWMDDGTNGWMDGKLHKKWSRHPLLYVIGELLQVIKIIFELQRKKSTEKKARRKISFPTHKICFSFLLLFELLLLSKLLTFEFLVHFNDLKCYSSVTWRFTNHLWTLIGTKILFWMFKNQFHNVWWFVCFILFLEFLITYFEGP